MTNRAAEAMNVAARQHPHGKWGCLRLDYKEGELQKPLIWVTVIAAAQQVQGRGMHMAKDQRKERLSGARCGPRMDTRMGA
jgi:hypothetical protein